MNVLPHDVQRCTGANTDGECPVRATCLRYTERGDRGEATPNSAAPAIDDTGCILFWPATLRADRNADLYPIPEFLRKKE